MEIVNTSTDFLMDSDLEDIELDGWPISKELAKKLSPSNTLWVSSNIQRLMEIKFNENTVDMLEDRSDLLEIVFSEEDWSYFMKCSASYLNNELIIQKKEENYILLKEQWGEGKETKYEILWDFETWLSGIPTSKIVKEREAAKIKKKQEAKEQEEKKKLHPMF